MKRGRPYHPELKAEEESKADDDVTPSISTTERKTQSL